MSTQILCRYYLHGACKRGDSCSYVHNLSTGKPDLTCRFYLSGTCSYGQKCRYDHVKPKADTNTSQRKYGVALNAHNVQNNEPELYTSKDNFVIKADDIGMFPSHEMMQQRLPISCYTEPLMLYDPYNMTYNDVESDFGECILYPRDDLFWTGEEEGLAPYKLLRAGNDDYPAFSSADGDYAAYNEGADISGAFVIGAVYNGVDESSTAYSRHASYDGVGESCTAYSAMSGEQAIYNGVDGEGTVYDGVDDSCTTYGGHEVYNGDNEGYAIYEGEDDGAAYGGLHMAYGGEEDCVAMYSKCNAYDESNGQSEMDICEYCGLFILSRADQLQREQHIKECIEEHEKDMEEAFRVAASEDRVCSVCMEIVWQKSPPWRRRFGILSACNHVFCLECIRKWRAEDGYDHQVIRACPECRVLSDFVTPSKYWFETNEDKMKLIAEYKTALSRKPCIYYKERDGDCPFGDSCFYLHDGPTQRCTRCGESGVPERASRNLISNFIGLAEEMRSLLLTDLLSLLDTDHIL